MHNDLFVAEQVYASVSDKSKVVILRNELDPQKVKFVISKLDFLLTARMHPSIHSLSVGVPVIGIDYNAKMRSLLSMFELDCLCVGLPQLNRQSLVEKIDSLVNELTATKRRVAASKSRLVHREDYLDQIRICRATAQNGESQ
jgi:polysaccharide pyruvyl transferase WcaK-like protein